MIHVGTSGYNYEAWRGSFYPEDLPARKMLSHYASQFSTVEINYSFYRKPTPKILQGWAAQVPAEFRFALKAWQRITHQKRLREATELVEQFADAACADAHYNLAHLYEVRGDAAAALRHLRTYRKLVQA